MAASTPSEVGEEVCLATARRGLSALTVHGASVPVDAKTQTTHRFMLGPCCVASTLRPGCVASPPRLLTGLVQSVEQTAGREAGDTPAPAAGLANSCVIMQTMEEISMREIIL